jgi:hypothetical protein
VGTPGNSNGHLQYPYGLAIDGESVYVADRNNHRIQVRVDRSSIDEKISEIWSLEPFQKSVEKGVGGSRGAEGVQSHLILRCHGL